MTQPSFDAVTTHPTDVERVALAVEGAGDGFWDWNIPSGTVHFSTQWCRMLGYEPGEIEPSVRSWEERVHPDDLPRVLDVLRQHLAGGADRYETIHRMRRKDGQWAWILDRGQVVERDDAGNPVRAVGTHADVTLHREETEALGRAEARARVQLAELEATYRAAPAGLGFLDRDLRYVRVNERLAAMNGCSVEEHIGRSLTEVLPSLASTLEPLLRHVVDTGIPIVGLEFRAPNFSEPDVIRDWLVNYEPVRDAVGSVIGVNVAVAEITALKRAEAQRDALLAAAGAFNAAVTVQEVTRVLLRESSRALSAAAGLVAVTHDATSEMEIVDTVGYPSEVQEYLEGAWRRCPLDAPIPMTKAVRTGQPVYFASEAERMAQFPAGPPTGYEAGCVVPLHAGGRIVGALALSFDQPHGLAPEQCALLDSLALQWGQALDRARLFEAESRARAEAESARQAADEANRAKSDFLAVMSHELRTPLNAIGGYVQILEMELHGPVSTSQRDVLARIDRAQRTLLRRINDVLNFARLQSGQVEYAVRSFPLIEVVRELEAYVEPQLQEKSLRYRTHIPDDCMVVADPDRLLQIFLNLLSNAVRFTSAGGEIVVECVQRAEGGDDPAWVHVRVRDTGGGIPMAKLDRIFDPFVQVADTVAGRAGGTGLGLAISRDLARGMGGDLRVRSTVGEGSSFTVRLPAAATLADAR